MDIIQSTIYYALRNIDFGFITARKNGKLVVAEDMRCFDLRPNIVAQNKVLDMIASCDKDWWVEAIGSGKMLIAKYYAETDSDGKGYLVSVVRDEQNKRNDSYFVEYLKNGCRLERYEGADLIEERFCAIRSARAAIKRLLYTEF